MLKSRADEMLRLKKIEATDPPSTSHRRKALCRIAWQHDGNALGKFVPRDHSEWTEGASVRREFVLPGGFPTQNARGEAQPTMSLAPPNKRILENSASASGTAVRESSRDRSQERISCRIKI
jgi:hypothetical protein